MSHRSKFVDAVFGEGKYKVLAINKDKFDSRTAYGMATVEFDCQPSQLDMRYGWVRHKWGTDNKGNKYQGWFLEVQQCNHAVMVYLFKKLDFSEEYMRSKGESK